MNDKKNNRLFLAVILGLVLLGFAGFYVIYSQNFYPNNLSIPQPNQYTNLMPTEIPTTLVHKSNCDYCFIQEVHPDFIRNSTIVHLTSADLNDFPQYDEGIKSGKNNQRDWINGQRTVSDFHDCEQQIEEFWNLSCRYIPYPECKTKDAPKVFEYDGRYYEISCLPGFDNLAGPITQAGER
ncbi:MAG: hypothetical protein WC379_12945 [Methanoregula sp.]|jgi:hypothetical protein